HPATLTSPSTLSLHDALPISRLSCSARVQVRERAPELLALRGEGGERAREPPLPLGSEPKMRDPRIHRRCFPLDETGLLRAPDEDRKSTRLNSSHDQRSYAVF